MRQWQTGGNNYYMIFNKGNHEIRRITSNEYDYEVVFRGHWEKCESKMKEIIESNVDYDYNL